jgi:stage III sporulation protein AG
MDGWKKVIQKAGPMRLCAVVLCGIVLLVISCSGNFEKKAETETVSEEVSQTEELDRYRSKMKQELVELLGQVQGVGTVEVMLTLKASTEKVTLKDSTDKGDSTQEETVLIEDSDKNSSPYVLQEKEPELEGVVIVCDGGDDVSVKKEITEAVSALFQIETHKIKVMKSKEK